MEAGLEARAPLSGADPAVELERALKRQGDAGVSRVALHEAPYDQSVCSAMFPHQPWPGKNRKDGRVICSKMLDTCSPPIEMLSRETGGHPEPALIVPAVGVTR